MIVQFSIDVLIQ